MKPILATLLISLTPIPALGCYNDSSTYKVEEEFRSRYNQIEFEGPAQSDTKISYLAVATIGLAPCIITLSIFLLLRAAKRSRLPAEVPAP